MNNQNYLRLLRFLPIALAFFVTLSYAEKGCKDTVVVSLKAALKIGEENNIRASTCKQWPDDKNKMLVAIVYEPPKYTDLQLPLHIVMVNTDTLNILSHYEGEISEEATIRVNEDSLQFDTARYFLAKEIRAFGLRVQANVEPRFSEGGSDDNLSLYIVEGKEIRLVLPELTMRHWSYEDIPAQGGTDNHTIIETNLTLDIAPTKSHGYADLLITAKTTGRKNGGKKIRTHKLQYDGKLYRSPLDIIELRIKLHGDQSN